MSIIHNKNLLLMIFRKDLLKDKVAIVSGGATGICLDISRALLENGASVHIISRKI
jgi:NADP-dependent 3-hydroxy acid dehydrogenase YdfG